MGKVKDAFTPWGQVRDYEDERLYRRIDWECVREVEERVVERVDSEMLEFRIKYTTSWGTAGSYGVSMRPQENIYAQLVRMARNWENPTYYWLLKNDTGWTEVQILGDLQWQEMEN